MIKVLFVCLGNVCRSPLAEGIFRHLVESRGLSGEIACDSCGTSHYHEGDQPHRLSCAVAQAHGFALAHRARVLASHDFTDFDYLLAMDSHNLHNIRNVVGAAAASDKIFLMRSFDNLKSGKLVSDPYGGDESDFEECYQVLEECSLNFLAYLIEKHGLA